MVNKIDDIEIRLKEQHDFSWLKKYGTAFWAVDETGSGCVCIGMEDEKQRYFCKIAGVNTLEADVTPDESIAILKNAVSIYMDLEHQSLIRLIDAYEYEQFYVAVFDWAEGECLFDHWNFEKYDENPTLKSPKTRFKELPIEKRLQAVEVLFSFLLHVHKNGYVAVDFYDGSIMYDFARDKTTICDIDFFRKEPVINDKGEDWFGTKRLKAPEEYCKGAGIDEKTNLFTLGALIFEFFGEFTEEDIVKRYVENRFIPCENDKWELSKEAYQIVKKAVSEKREDRYNSLDEFYEMWKLETYNS